MITQKSGVAVVTRHAKNDPLAMLIGMEQLEICYVARQQPWKRTAHERLAFDAIVRSFLVSSGIYKFMPLGGSVKTMDEMLPKCVVRDHARLNISSTETTDVGVDTNYDLPVVGDSTQLLL